MILYLLNLLMVTTHALHLIVTLIKPSSSLKVTHRSFRHASPNLWNQLPMSLRIPHPNYSSPSQWPSFQQTSLTCYSLLSPSITVSLLHSELKKIVPKILCSTLVCFCLSDWSYGSRQFARLTCSLVLWFSSIFSVLVIPMCSRQSWQALWSARLPYRYC